MAENESTKKMRTRKLVFFTIITFFILGLLAVWYSSYKGHHTKKGLLTLHGWVEGTEISLSSKVTGNIIEIPVDEGYDVKTGDLIVRIDSKQIKARLDAAKAEVNNAREALKRAVNDVSIFESKVEGAKIALNLSRKQSAAKIREAEASLESTTERLKKSEYNFIKAEKDHIRFSALIKKKKISQSKMDSIEEIYHVSEAEVERTGKDLEMSEAGLSLARTTISEIKLRGNELETLQREFVKAKTEVAIAQSVIETAHARQKEAAATMEDTYIYTPVEGTIVEKFVELGEHVVPGTPTVLIIDMAQLYIKTYVEEIHIGKIKYSSQARIYVDSFPDRYFEGKITFIAPKAEFTPRDVQMDEHRSRIVYKVEVGIINPEGILKPGMPADVDIKWGVDKW